MARSSPGVRRMVAVLNFFAEHPGQAFTLTDLVRALKLSRATCHALLTGLVEAGYLYRTGDKSYLIGPALVALGRIAQEHFSPLQVAQPEMRALADEFDVICSAGFREGNELVVRARAASMSHLGWSIPWGSHLPLRPPFGGIFFAWSPPSEVEAWLDQLEPPPTPEERDEMRHCMTFARKHGFSCGVRSADFPARPDALELSLSQMGDAGSLPVISEINPNQTYYPNHVIAPVFDARGRVAFILGLMGFTAPMPGAKIERIGHRLREACGRITAFIAGHPPELAPSRPEHA